MRGKSGRPRYKKCRQEHFVVLMTPEIGGIKKIRAPVKPEPAQRLARACGVQIGQTMRQPNMYGENACRIDSSRLHDRASYIIRDHRERGCATTCILECALALERFFG